MNDTNTLIIGIGNKFRSDDAAGLIAASRIKDLRLDKTDVEESAGDGAGLIDTWTGRKNVILIDAVLSGSAPGTVHRLELTSRLLPTEFFKFSTHLFSIPQAIYLSASLGTLPDKLLILGIEGKSFDPGEAISGEAESAINNIVNIVQQEVKNFQRNPREKLINE
jgi:hydrogenase maturation protease